MYEIYNTRNNTDLSDGETDKIFDAISNGDGFIYFDDFQKFMHKPNEQLE